MANSYVEYTGDGSTVIYSWPKPFLDRDHVLVYVDDVSVGFSWISDSSVQLDSAPADGAAIKIQRETPHTALVTFTNGANLTRAALDTVFLQSVYIAEEEAEQVAANPAVAINDVTDIVITTPADNEVLAYDTTSGNWINQTAAEAGLAVASHTHSASEITAGTLVHERGGLEADVSAYSGLVKISGGTTSAVTDNSSNWDAAFGWGDHASAGYITGVPTQDDGSPILTATTLNFVGTGVVVTDGGSGVATVTISGGYINDVTDIVITTPADNEVLAYDTTSGNWINQTAAEAGLAAASHTHATSEITSGTFADARIAASNVIQHQGSIDHGSIAGLADDDHTQYVLAAGTRAITGKQTFNAGVVINGEIVEETYAWTQTSGSVTTDLDPANGTVHRVTLTGNITAMTDNLAEGESLELAIDDGAGYSIVFPTIEWENNTGVAPTLATVGYTRVAIWKENSTLYGALLMDGT